MFEIGSPATASGVVPSDVSLGLDDGAEYDDEDYESVTHLGLGDVSTTPFPYEDPRRGDPGTYSMPRVLSPRRLPTERHPGPPTERTRSFQPPAETFPQQHAQVIDVDEVEETGVGTAIYVIAGMSQDRRGSVVCLIWQFGRLRPGEVGVAIAAVELCWMGLVASETPRDLWGLRLWSQELPSGCSFKFPLTPFVCLKEKRALEVF